MSKWYEVIKNVTVEITDEEIVEAKKWIEANNNDGYHFDLDDSLKELAEEKRWDAEQAGCVEYDVREC
jgi:hypothetical protein